MPKPTDLWTPEDSAKAVPQGWDMFTAAHTDGTPEVLEIEKDDDFPTFKDDTDALRWVFQRAMAGDPLAQKAVYLHNTPTTFDVDPGPLELLNRPRPTVIDNAEVFDSEGTLSLQIGDYDILYLSKCRPEGDDYPKLGDEDHQRIIDVIVGALNVGVPEPSTPGPMTLKRFDLTGRQTEIVRIALNSTSCNINDINDAMEPTDTPLNKVEVEGVLAVFN